MLSKKNALNGICPYFTMFPLDFPYMILKQDATAEQWVLDPFCGRGTTSYASRMLGLASIGIDSNPVAVALSQAKLANTSPLSILQEAERILNEVSVPRDVPIGEFWEWAFHNEVLDIVCRLREGLLKDCQSDTRKALRAIVMGALHGPRPKRRPSYLSNQSQRTYAPKPRYAVNYWKIRQMIPECVDTLAIIEARAQRFYGSEDQTAVGMIIHGDSREKRTYEALGVEKKIHWVITSPPYYGMRTYLPDQWLRGWFLGGPPHVEYSAEGQVRHASPIIFASELQAVWQRVGAVCVSGAKLVIRFGAINDRKVDALALLRQSLKDSGWSVGKITSAGSASKGRRQVLHITHQQKAALEEYDVWGTWDG